jgi:hypothetical protein
VSGHLARQVEARVHCGHHPHLDPVAADGPKQRQVREIVLQHRFLLLAFSNCLLPLSRSCIVSNCRLVPLSPRMQPRQPRRCAAASHQPEGVQEARAAARGKERGGQLSAERAWLGMVDAYRATGSVRPRARACVILEHLRWCTPPDCAKGCNHARRDRSGHFHAAYRVPYSTAPGAAEGGCSSTPSSAVSPRDADLASAKRVAA